MRGWFGLMERGGVVAGRRAGGVGWAARGDAPRAGTAPPLRPQGSLRDRCATAYGRPGPRSLCGT